MSKPNPAALEFMQTRRSRSPKTLVAPAPNGAEIRTLLTIAARTPDHKMLVPWRFIVLEGAALSRIGDQAAKWGAERDLTEDQVLKTVNAFKNSPLCIAVVYSPKQGTPVPFEEQVLSAGAVCLALTNGALASGWGAGWISGWAAFDHDFCAEALNMGGHEYVAGFVHIGTETVIPQDRKRPNIDDITEWVSQ